jgi:reactive chlorine resistance protein C
MSQIQSNQAISIFKDVISLGVSFYLFSYFGKKAVLDENKS